MRLAVMPATLCPTKTRHQSCWRFSRVSFRQPSLLPVLDWFCLSSVLCLRFVGEELPLHRVDLSYDDFAA